MLKQSATEAFKTDSKRGFQIRAEATGDFIGNKIANKITEVSKKKSLQNENDKEITKERYISPEKRQ